MSEIELLLLEFTSAVQKIEAAYQNAGRSLKKRIKNDLEVTE